MDARDWEPVARFSHTLKGRAGLLGMDEIAAIAGQLETAARAGDRTRAQAALQQLEAQLRPIVDGLARVLPADLLSEASAATAPEPDPDP